MNIYADFITPAVNVARAIVHWPKTSEATWFPRQGHEPQDVKFVAWLDRNTRGWKVGKVDGVMPAYWGAAWVHVTAQDGVTKWLRFDEIPYVQ